MRTVPDSQQGYEDDGWSQYHGNDVCLHCVEYLCVKI